MTLRSPRGTTSPRSSASTIGCSRATSRALVTPSRTFPRRAGSETFGKEVAAQLVRFLDTLEKMGDIAISSFLSRRRVQARRTYTEVAAMRERVGELSKGLISMKGTSTGVMVDLLATLERVASIFVDVSDLALPTYQFRPE